MYIKPLWLREKLFWRLYLRHSKRFSGLFQNACLELAPSVFIDLLETDISHQMIAFTGFYELPVSCEILKLAKDGGLMVDVGANYGYYSCLWASGHPNNQVLAFEASPSNASALSSNLSSNKFESQVQVRELAVGKETGKLQFDLGPAEQSGWGGICLEESQNSFEVSVVSLDDLFKHQSKDIDVLKIDTEGADTWVIEGALNLLKDNRISHIFFEENKTRMAQLGIKSGIAQKILSECGYLVEKIDTEEWHACLVD